MQKELEKNLSNDEVFNAINKIFISLEDDEIRTINESLLLVIEKMINFMKSEDSLFKEIYQEIIFIGSFYKGTKIEKPNEFDLNIILKLPFNNKQINFYSERPAFVQIQIDQSTMYNSKYDHLTDKGKKIYNNIIDYGYLNPNKFRRWIQGILYKVLHKRLTKVDNGYELIINKQLKAKIRIKESGPAYTLIINIETETKTKTIHVDLAPALAFHINYINQFIFKFNELQNCRNKTWFAIPLPLTDDDINNKNFYWRLSFSCQEKEILTKYGRIKPVIRQMKKLRDTQNWNSIASYFIETLFLHKKEELKNDLEKIPFTLFLFKMLQELYYACDKHTLEFYWDKNYNLFSKISEREMYNITYRLKNIIKSIERCSSDKFILASFILNSQELKLLQEKINNNNQYVEDKNDTEQENSKWCTIT